MVRLLQIILAGACLACTLPGVSRGEEKTENDQDRLQGAWQAQSMEVDGQPGPEDAVKRMKFIFEGEKLRLFGNHKEDDSEMKATYKIDAGESPKHLNFTPEELKKPILAIYKFEGDDLKVCIRHAQSSKGRPTEFKTTEGSELVLIVFQKQKKEKQ